MPPCPGVHGGMGRGFMWLHTWRLPPCTSVPPTRSTRPYHLPHPHPVVVACKWAEFQGEGMIFENAVYWRGRGPWGSRRRAHPSAWQAGVIYIMNWPLVPLMSWRGPPCGLWPCCWLSWLKGTMHEMGRPPLPVSGPFCCSIPFVLFFLAGYTTTPTHPYPCWCYAYMHAWMRHVHVWGVG
jgi:hypothetical protein